MNARIQHILQRWKQIAHTVADFQARLILSVLYVLFIVPVGLFVRFNDDPLAMKEPPDSSAQWRTRNSKPDTVRRAHRQY